MKMPIGKRRISAPTLPAARFLVEHAVDQPVGKRVLLARHVLDVDLLEAAQQCPRALVERHAGPRS